ncbi:hypothetical protein [Sorangium sp. So ce1151]|uniref:hypothetical protein n=1 Tax=Sorangium sp. So ce1151 TaxID=3133332 RepID=UPI003F62F1B9
MPSLLGEPQPDEELRDLGLLLQGQVHDPRHCLHGRLGLTTEDPQPLQVVVVALQRERRADAALTRCSMR